MITGCRRTDWLAPCAAEPRGEEAYRRAHQDTGDSDRRRDQRRTGDRRAPRRAADPLFVATLIDQITAPEARLAPAVTRAYPARAPRAGLAFNIRA